MARSKAYLFGGVEIRWACDPSLLPADGKTPARATFHFPGGLKDYLEGSLGDEQRVTTQTFAGKTEKISGHGAVEWAVSWTGGGRRSSGPTATPSRRPRAARTRRACATS